jgi:hypothetical protein
MSQHSTSQGRHFKPIDVTRNHDLVELWADMLASPPRWPTLPTSPTFDRGLYRRICASRIHPRTVNVSLWTSLAITNWWSYVLICLLLPRPPPRPVYIALQSLARNPLVIAVACHEVVLDRFCVNGAEIGYSDEDLSLVRCWFGEASIFRFFGVRFLPSRS